MSQKARFLLKSWSNHSRSSQYQDRPSLFSPRPNCCHQGNRIGWHRWPGNHLGRLERTDCTNSKPRICCCKCNINCYIIYSNFGQTEAGCRVLINLILLHVVSAMSDGQTDVDIILEYPIATTTFSENHSFAGIVDFLVAKLPARYTQAALIEARTSGSSSPSVGSQ